MQWFPAQVAHIASTFVVTLNWVDLDANVETYVLFILVLSLAVEERDTSVRALGSLEYCRYIPQISPLFWACTRCGPSFQTCVFLPAAPSAFEDAVAAGALAAGIADAAGLAFQCGNGQESPREQCLPMATNLHGSLW